MKSSSSTQGVWFSSWEEALAQARLRDLERRAYRVAILEFLRFCKRSRQRATVKSARRFMEKIENQRRLTVTQLATWKDALN
jgi:hypothetical protein